MSDKKTKKRPRSLDLEWYETKINKKLIPSCSEGQNTSFKGDLGPEDYYEPSLFMDIDSNNTNSDQNVKHESVIEEFIDEDFIVNKNCIVNSPGLRLDRNSRPSKRKYFNESVSELERSNPNCGNYFYSTYPNGTFLIIDRGTVYFYGSMEIKVIYGTLEVLGYTLNKDSSPVKLYSPRGHSLLYLKNPNIPNEDKFLLHNLLPDLKDYEPNKWVSCQCCIIKCQVINEKNIIFIEKHISQQILPKLDNAEIPQIILEPLGTWNLIKTHPDWNLPLNSATRNTKLMICGGKGVGKSTYLRYAINRLLMEFNKIRIIDVDPGQAEFTTPGCISVLTIEEPIFGPNFTHLKRPERSILCNINIGYDPGKYIESIKLLLKDSENWEAVPTLINYMGFTDGIGINIISSAIYIIQPTILVQINSTNRKKNFKNFLQPRTVKLNATLFTPFVREDLDYNFICIESMTNENVGWSLEARQGREICILSYFGQGINNKDFSILDLPMFEIHLSKIKICNFTGETIPPAAINGNLVALCDDVEHEEKQIYQCLGWGIVRGIDLEKQQLVLLTVESDLIVEKVNYLILTGLLLPPSIYMTPDSALGEIPYVISGDLVNFGQITKRSVVSPRN